MIESLISALHRIRLKPTAQEFCDMLWLALQMGEPAQQGPKSEVVEIPESRDERASEKKPEPSKHEVAGKKKEAPPPSPITRAYSQASRTEEARGKAFGQPFRSPAASALPGPLAIARAMRPLMRRIPSNKNEVMDESATAQKIAEQHIWTPVMRPAPERWLEVALVIDQSSSMVIWQQTLRELRLLLERLGAFRDVRVWRLNTDGTDGEVKLYEGARRSGESPGFRSPFELIDPKQQRLILVASDCISPAWRNGTILDVLAAWERHAPVAIFQVLSQQLWPGTALDAAIGVDLRAPQPGPVNRRLLAKPRGLWLEEDLPKGLKMPVVTLEPESISAWARMMAGAGDAWARGFVFEKGGKTTEESDLQPDEGLQQRLRRTRLLSPAQRVNHFMATASPSAQKLASYFAAAPLTLPVMRLVQKTMMPESRQVHFAEVFLGGLLRQVTSIKEDDNPDLIQYEFYDDVRDILLNNVLATEAVQVLSEISREVLKKTSGYIESRIGHTLDFQALLEDPTRTDGVEINEQNRPFALIAARVLRRLGGQYTNLAARLENKSAGSSREEIEGSPDEDSQSLYTRQQSIADAVVITPPPGEVVPPSLEVIDPLHKDQGQKSHAGRAGFIPGPEPDDFIWGSGIEDTFVPQTRPGHRSLDEYELMGHYQHWREDLALARDAGVSALRWGVPWYRVQPYPNEFDWVWIDQVIPYMVEELGITPIIDLVSHGCPFWLRREFVNVEYPRAVATYAATFAERYKNLVRWYTPLNEPITTALMSGKRGLWPPYLRGDGGYIRVMMQLAKGIIATVNAIKSVQPEAVMVHVEAASLSRAARSDLEALATEEQRRSRISYDLITGRVAREHPLLGWLLRNGASQDDLLWLASNAINLDVIGLNFYPQQSTQELHIDRKGKLAYRDVEPEGGGFAELLSDYYHRYAVPIMVTGTSVPGSHEARSEWLKASVSAIRSLRAQGVPVLGYFWYPLFTRIDPRYRFGRNLVDDYRTEPGLYKLTHRDSPARWASTPLIDQLHDYIINPHEVIGYLSQA